MQLSDIMTRRLYKTHSCLYSIFMSSNLFNLRVLGEKRRREQLLSWFLDGYAQSLDLTPDCYRAVRRKEAKALWGDFVKVAADMRRATDRVGKHAARPGKTVSHD